MEINPDLYVAESNFDNNVVSCHLRYNAYSATLRDCHYTSLLDYRRPQKLPAEGKTVSHLKFLMFTFADDV